MREPFAGGICRFFPQAAAHPIRGENASRLIDMTARI